MKCNQCGNQIKDDVRFCNKCGNEIPKETAFDTLSNNFNVVLIFLRKIPQKTWRTIIIVCGIVTAYYGIIGGIIGFLIWKSVDNNFAKKLVKISAVIWGIWIVGTTAVYFGFNYYEQQQYLKQTEQQRIDDEIGGDTDTPIPSFNNSSSTNSSIPGNFPKASQRLLTQNDILELSKWNLKIMRNEIFARHGYIFKTHDMKSYFATQSWYHGQYTDVASMLSNIEQQNVALIKRYE